MKKHVNYIDNLRWITVSLLILYHTAMAYNTWGEANYIFFEEVNPIASIVTFISPWFMPLMFLLAGVASSYSLRKRGYGAFLRERLVRLGIPLLLGILILTPILSYVADVTHNGYSDGFFKHYGIFFGRFTDLTGYDGGFTMAHLWFLAVLILISFLSVAILRICRTGMCHGNDVIESESYKNERDQNRSGTKTKVILGVLLSILSIATFDVRFGGKPLILYLGVYFLGYYIFSDPESVDRISRFKWIFVIVFLAVSITDVVLFIYVKGYETLNTICNYVAFAVAIPALISLGHDHLDFQNRISVFNAKISYTFYILHFPVVVLLQYAFWLMNMNSITGFILTVVIAYPMTFGLCCAVEAMKRFVKKIAEVRRVEASE
ncbi:MAG: acyltransferase [Eubacterium sp.]|nr:acyltransferase [Eubacterium sp.]